MTQVGPLGRTAGSQWWLDLLQPSSDRDAEPERLLGKLGRLPTPPKQANRCLVCSILVLPFIQLNCFVYCIRLPAPLRILKGYLTATAGIWRVSCMERLYWQISGIFLYCAGRNVAKQIHLPLGIERITCIYFSLCGKMILLMWNDMSVLLQDNFVVVPNYHNRFVEKDFGVWKPAVPQDSQSKSWHDEPGA